MTRQELASFALKLLGIYTIVESLPFIQTFWGALMMLGVEHGRSPIGFWQFAAMMIAPALRMAVGILLLALSGSLAPLLVGEDKPLGSSTALNGDDVQAIGFSIVAVLIFLQAIPQLTQGITNLPYILGDSSLDPASQRIGRSVLLAGLSGGIQAALAVWLFVRPRDLVNLWRRHQPGKSVGVDEAGR
ncbi:MAG: hypothetical protein ACM3VT_11260 [Solirubrobacterales bacterium]